MSLLCLYCPADQCVDSVLNSCSVIIHFKFVEDHCWLFRVKTENGYNFTVIVTTKICLECVICSAAICQLSLLLICVSLSVSLYVCVSLCLCLSLCVSLAVSLAVSLSLCPSVCVSLPVSLAVCLSGCVSLSVSLCLCLSVCVSLCLCLWLCVSVCFLCRCVPVHCEL